MRYDPNFTGPLDVNNPKQAEVTPLGDTGNSHFSYVDPNSNYLRDECNTGLHITTPLHNLGQTDGEQGLRIVDNFNLNNIQYP